MEDVVHYILNVYRCNSNREHFECNINHIKTVIVLVGNLINTLKSSFHNITQEELIDRVNESMCIKVEIS